ncbi:MAG: type II toxin-antitoxin system RelE/ParE family toxin [Prevotella sp.]|nr:type II toxin-antitoxin system RelE/ParE family toxin [Prevotella sp.]
MRVKWNNQAKAQLYNTAAYIGYLFGKKAMVSFMKDVVKKTSLLEVSPELGKIEPLLSDRSVTYRSLVIGKLNKIVYHINDDCIEVNAFWHTRREPQSLTDEVK